MIDQANQRVVKFAQFLSDQLGCSVVMTLRQLGRLLRNLLANSAGLSLRSIGHHSNSLRGRRLSGTAAPATTCRTARGRKLSDTTNNCRATGSRPSHPATSKRGMTTASTFFLDQSEFRKARACESRNPRDLSTTRGAAGGAEKSLWSIAFMIRRAVTSLASFNTAASIPDASSCCRLSAHRRHAAISA